MQYECMAPDLISFLYSWWSSRAVRLLSSHWQTKQDLRVDRFGAKLLLPVDPRDYSCNWYWIFTYVTFFGDQCGSWTVWLGKCSSVACHALAYVCTTLPFEPLELVAKMKRGICALLCLFGVRYCARVVRTSRTRNSYSIFAFFSEFSKIHFFLPSSAVEAICGLDGEGVAGYGSKANNSSKRT
jgi:hypothetical protein